MAQETLKLTSPCIDHEGRLPRKYTGDGQGAQKNISPPVEWHNIPEGAKSLALVVQDLDPVVPWTHWVVANIPPSIRGLPEGFSGKDEGDEFTGIKEGSNDDKVPGWRGPKLPSDGQAFEFRLYALDLDDLRLGNKVTKDKLLESIEGHVLAEAQLVAFY